jgi:hypothetical protein
MDATASAVRLLRNYDVDRLLRDLESCEPFCDTLLFEHAPYIREIVDGLESSVSSVRLSSLHAGGRIYEHSDGDGFELGKGEEIRLHLPITTSDDVWFVVDKVRYPLRAGELWYGDFTKPHWVENRSQEARIHLMVDTRVSETVLHMFPAEYLEGRTVRADPPPGALASELRGLAGFTLQLGGVDDELDRAIAPLPPGFQDLLRATFGERNEVRWIDGKLWAVVRGHPAFMFEIERARRLRVAYQPAVVELDLDDGRPVKGSLELTVFGQFFRLPLRVGTLS